MHDFKDFEFLVVID